MNTKLPVFVLFALLLSCDPELPPYDVPYLPFDDIFVNLNAPENQALKVDGGYITIASGGVRGILLYRQSATVYFAYEKNCTWDANSACATVEADNSGLFMTDPCCGSSFSWNTGEPIGGLAVYPLRRYFTAIDGSTLLITDEIIN